MIKKIIQKTKKIQKIFLILFLFIVLTVINTYPLILHINTHAAGHSEDHFQNMWNFWWMNKSVFDLKQNPYFSQYIFYPDGASLVLHTLSPISSLISIPLQHLLDNNLVLTYNLIFIFTIALVGLSMHTLAYYLTKNHFASFMAGYLLAFSPYMLEHAMGHLNLIAIYFLPLYILFLIKLKNNQSIKNIIWLALFAILTFYTDFYQMIFLFFFTIIYLIYRLIFDRVGLNKKYFLSLFFVVLIILIFTSPLLIKSTEAFFSNKFTPNHDIYYWSPDILTFFTVGPNSPFYRIAGHVKANNQNIENQNYIGLTVLFLLIIGFIRIKSNTKFWYFSAAAFFIFSLGSILKISGHDLFTLPYYYIFKIFPFISISSRFMALFYISTAVICAFSIKYLLAKTDLKIKKVTLGATVFLLVFLEFQIVPFKLTAVNVPEFYYKINNDPEEYVIADATIVEHNGLGMYYQTIHQKKILAGYISRHNLSLMNFLLNEPVVSDIFQYLLGYEVSFTQDEAWTKQLKAKMAEINVKYIIIPLFHNIELKDFEEFYRDDTIIVYQVY